MAREVEARRSVQSTESRGARVEFCRTRHVRLWRTQRGARGPTRTWLRDLRRARGELLCSAPEHIVVRQSGRRLTLAELHGYRTLCGLPDEGEVPATLPEFLFVPLMVRLCSEPTFPTSSLGLLVVAASLEQRQPLSPNSALELRCELAEVRRTKRGIELDLALRAADELGGDWRGTTTWLSPNKGLGSRWQDSPSASAQSLSVSGRSVEVPLDIGRRYGELTGDFGLQHLHRLGARAVGLQFPVAHGMWVLGRALSHVATQHELGPCVSVQAQFTRPVRLPSRIAIAQRERASDARTPPIDFEVTDSVTQVPHLVGQVRALDRKRPS